MLFSLFATLSSRPFDLKFSCRVCMCVCVCALGASQSYSVQALGPAVLEALNPELQSLSSANCMCGRDNNLLKNDGLRLRTYPEP